MHGRFLDVSSLHPDGELDILSFAGKDASAEFDMFHPLGVIVNFAQEAIIASLGTGGESVCAHVSHVSAVAQVASSGVAGRIVLKPTRTEGTEWMDTEKLSILVIEPFIHMVLAFMNGGQEPRTETAMSAKRSGRGVLTWHPSFQSVCTLQSCTMRIYLQSYTAPDNACTHWLKDRLEENISSTYPST